MKVEPPMTISDKIYDTEEIKEAVVENSTVEEVKEESKESVQQKLVAASPRPSFDSVIKGQASSGFWEASSRSILTQCIEGEQIEDQTVKEALE